MDLMIALIIAITEGSNVNGSPGYSFDKDG